MPRIALVGPSGSGKTTLVKEINKKCNTPVRQLSTEQVMSNYNLQTHHDVVSIASAIPRIGIEFQLDLITSRVKYFLGQSGDNYITDRTPLDSFVYYLIHNSFYDTDSNFSYLRELTKSCNKCFDIVFLMPAGVFPVDDGGGMRTKSKGYHELTENLMYQYGNELGYNIVKFPKHIININSRVEFIMAWSGLDENI